MSEYPSMTPIKVGVHSGTMHSDEVFAVAALSFIYPNMEVIRSRDPEVLKTCNILVDVGDDYNHTNQVYDHHMAWFKTRHRKPFRRRLPNGEYKEYDKGPLRSGFGLIWLHYGTDIVKALLTEYYKDLPVVLDSMREFDYLDIQQDLDNNLVARVDALDNGEGDQFDLNQEPFRGVDLQRLITSYNPSALVQNQTEPGQLDALYQHQFDLAVEFAKSILINECTSRAEQNYYRVKFQELLSKQDPHNPILVMETFMPWAYAYARAGEATNGIEMIVYPSTNDTWMCQTPRYYEKRDRARISPTMPDGTRRKNKHQAPANICGLRDTELANVTGIPDVVFVHRSGHLGAAKTKKAAIALAHYFINRGV